MNRTGILGNRAENLALKYLRKQGLQEIERNFHCRFGELDLIMQDAAYLVFVEVRYRKDQSYGGAVASVNQAKQRKLRRTAEFYLLQHKKNDCPCRFDILCMDGNLEKARYHWIRNAF
ncbi:MAG: YraN family protein [Gammaproteobacteria bacterium]|nr:YraN family protein [Gammaproteobacteria bacterium]